MTAAPRLRCGSVAPLTARRRCVPRWRRVRCGARSIDRARLLVWSVGGVLAGRRMAGGGRWGPQGDAGGGGDGRGAARDRARRSGQFGGVLAGWRMAAAPWPVIIKEFYRPAAARRRLPILPPPPATRRRPLQPATTVRRRPPPTATHHSAKTRAAKV